MGRLRKFISKISRFLDCNFKNQHGFKLSKIEILMQIAIVEPIFPILHIQGLSFEAKLRNRKFLSQCQAKLYKHLKHCISTFLCDFVACFEMLTDQSLPDETFKEISAWREFFLNYGRNSINPQKYSSRKKSLKVRSFLEHFVARFQVVNNPVQ